MKTINFSGPFAKDMTHFVKLKQISGSDYFAQAKLLLRFSLYLASLQLKEKRLTLPIFEDYFDTISHLCGRGFSNHYSVLRQFSAWLNQRVPQSYILEERRAVDRSHSRSAYIFSIDEIKAILQKSINFSPKEEIIPELYCTLFSLLYSSGIRIGEALALNHADYVPEDRLLHIRKGKFRKERYLIVSNSAANQMNKYISHYRSMLTLEEESPFFVNIHRKRLTYISAHRALRKVLKKIGINMDDSGPGLHDFRHTFAIHRLLQWYKSEKDINLKLPYLSTYMGHVDITSTQVYLQVANELLEAGSERFHKFFLNHNLTKGLIS